MDYEHGRLLELLTISNKSVEFVWWLLLETWQASQKLQSRVAKTYGILDNWLQEEKCSFSNIVFSQITANLGIFVLVIRW